MADPAPTQLNREALTIIFDGRAINLSRQHIIDTAAQVGWLVTDADAVAVQDRILTKGWRLALRESTYSPDPVDQHIRNFVGANGADVHFWLWNSLDSIRRFGPGPNDYKIDVMRALIARRAAKAVA